MPDHPEKEEEKQKRKRLMSGTFFNTLRVAGGHGFFLEHEGAREMAVNGSKGKPVVENHGRDLSAVAGVLKETGARPVKGEMPTFDLNTGKVTGSREEEGFMGAFLAELTDSAPKGSAIIDHLELADELGFIPNVSMGFVSSGAYLDEATGRVYLQAPYKLMHLGVVQGGAYSPDDGVGVGLQDVMQTLSAESRKVLETNPVMTLSASGGMVCLNEESVLNEEIRAHLDRIRGVEASGPPLKSRSGVESLKMSEGDDSAQGGQAKAELDAEAIKKDLLSELKGSLVDDLGALLDEKVKPLSEELTNLKNDREAEKEKRLSTLREKAAQALDVEAEKLEELGFASEEQLNFIVEKYQRKNPTRLRGNPGGHQDEPDKKFERLAEVHDWMVKSSEQWRKSLGNRNDFKETYALAQDKGVAGGDN